MKNVGGLPPHTKLAAARLAATRKMPYFAQALLSLAPREAPGLGTMAVTSRMVLMWDPAAVDGWTVQETATALLHEVGHVLRGHHGRCAACGADPRLWNQAADMEINDDLEAAGLLLPQGKGVFPKDIKKPDGLTAEEYYAELVQQNATQGGGGGPSGPGVGQGWCGSGGGNPVIGEPDTTDPASRSDQDIKRIEQQTAEAVRQHVATNGQGSVPGGWVAWAEVTLKTPKIPWQEKLARICRHAVAFRPGAILARYTKISRRQGGIGFGSGKPIIPALMAPVPRVGVAIDTSGSMGSQELERAVSECTAILKAVNAEVDFVACDSSVHASTKVRTAKEIMANLKGGGGTDFRPVFDAMSKRRPRPEVMIFVTDGCGPAPAHCPEGMAVIWLLVGPYRSKPTAYGKNPDGSDNWSHQGEVTWGTFIEVDDDAKSDDGVEI